MRNVARRRLQEWRCKAEQVTRIEKNRHLRILLRHDLGGVIADARIVQGREIRVPLIRNRFFPGLALLGNLLQPIGAFAHPRLAGGFGQSHES